ncbi:MAG TPA: HlyD family efflux transporter periplasmic adaptor subunit [Candidatus Methylomirabilis sp.]|nr:HlyD family efflux transporter periplasmic adaptor subunit [Candidatus Methylomirabilis sp.]
MTESAGRPPGGDEEATGAFLNIDPPHWAARGLALVLIGLALAVLAASLVIRLPETVTSPFVLVPVQGTDPIRAPRSGVVAAIRAGEGQTVSRGEPTVVIRSAAVGDRAAELRSLEAQLQGTEESRANARQKYESQRRTDDEEHGRLTRRISVLAQKLEEQRAIRAVREARFRTDLEIQQNTIDITLKETEFKRTQYALARELAERFERYHREGAISWLDYKNRELEMTKLAVEVQQLDRALETSRLHVHQLRAERETWDLEWKITSAELESEVREARAALEKLREGASGRDAEYRETDRRLREDAGKARIRVGALREEVGSSQGSELEIPAACAGTILRLAVKGPGAVVQEGELLGELACSGGRLQAEVSVAQTGIGLVKPGQEVKLLYDAFPYQRYGLKFGSVRWVSPASVTLRDQPVFRVLVDPRDTTVAVKGQPRPLLAGMGGTANIVVGTRSLLSYAFEPIRQLKESLAAPGS